MFKTSSDEIDVNCTKFTSIILIAAVRKIVKQKLASNFLFSINLEKAIL